MMFELYSHVRIRKLGITGMVIDRSADNGKSVYIVESDKKEAPRTDDAYPTAWPLYDCFEEDIESI